MIDQQLGTTWGELWERLDPAAPYQGEWADFRDRQLSEWLHGLLRRTSVPIAVTQVGVSAEGRGITGIRLGKGGRRVLTWARQHGDEPDCSAGLAMALEELVLGSHREPAVTILAELDLMVVPMVNPDGVVRFTRRNAQGIDINRDAIAGATPEGAALIGLKDSFKPEFCFNLHDMSPRKATPDGKQVAIAFQAAPVQDGGNTPLLAATKSVCALMAAAAGQKAAGHVAKYTADYMHRAFGDSMMRWGVGSMLIEAGGWPKDRGGDEFVRRLFALCLLRGLYALATGEDSEDRTDLYEAVPFDSARQFHDVLLRNSMVIGATGRPVYRADVAINRVRVGDRALARTCILSSIENLGDLEDERGIEEHDLADHVVMPGLTAIAPALRFADEVPSAAEAAIFHRAGITNLAMGFGPFASRRAREEWYAEVRRQPPPLNVIAFERISSLREIRARHGLTELAGFLVQDLELSVTDLIRLSHLYHPAQPAAVDPEAGVAETVAIDLFFQSGASPQDVQLHLHLMPARRNAGLSLIRQDELQALVDQFIAAPSQISFGVDALDEPLTWLPLLIGFGGLSGGRLPQECFFGNILWRFGAHDGSGVLSVLNMLALHNARALRFGKFGRIEIGQRAELTAFSSARLFDAADRHAVVPDFTMINGQRVHGPGANTREVTGSWHFSSSLQVR